MSDEVCITREELYEKVWSTPMMQLAKEYGMSDVGLAKICKKLEVPRPARGYWQKLDAGQKPKQTKLPALSKYGQDRAYIRPDKYRTYLPKIGSSTTKIELPEQLTNPHSLIEVTQHALQKGKPDEEGIIKTRTKQVLAIHVSPGMVDRALLIMDTILKGAEKRDYFIALEKQATGYCTTVTVEGKVIKISLSEIIRTIEHQPTDAEERRYQSQPWRIPRHDYIATGKLSLRIDNAENLGVRQRWNDAKVQRIDNCLGDFIDGLVAAARAMEAERIREEERHREWEQEEKVRKQRLREKRIEDKKIAKIEDEAEKWHRAEKIRAYITAMSQREDMMANLQIKAWVEWCGLYADYLDPLIFKQYELVVEDDVSCELW